MAKVDPRLQTAGVITGAILIIGLLAFLLIPVFKSLREALEGLEGIGDGLKDVLEGVGDVVGEAGDLASKAGTAAFNPGIVPGIINQEGNRDGSSKTVEKPDLEVRVLTKDDEVRKVNKWLDLKAKYTRATLKVVDKATGKGVPFATIHGRYKYALTDKTLGPLTLTTDREGYYRNLNWTVRDVAGTAKEDDLVVYATAPMFNDSAKVVLH